MIDMKFLASAMLATSLSALSFAFALAPIAA